MTRSPPNDGARCETPSCCVMATDARYPAMGVPAGATRSRPITSCRASPAAPSFDPANLRAACAECNNRKGSRERRDYQPKAAPEALTPLQQAIATRLDAAHAPHDIGRRTARLALPGGRYRSQDIDTACAWRRARGPTQHTADGW